MKSIASGSTQKTHVSAFHQIIQLLWTNYITGHIVFIHRTHIRPGVLQLCVVAQNTSLSDL